MKARLVDVAKAAGVSPKTVSNYVNGYPFISNKTSARVKAAIDKLHYVPNRSAQRLRTGKIGIIGLAVPYLNTPYFAELASRISDAAEERGYTLLIDQTGGDLARERRAITGVGPQTLDGVIVSPLKLSGEDVTAATHTLPTVLLGERAHPTGVPYVGVNNVAAAKTATEYLIRCGHRRIAAIGSVGTGSTGARSRPRTTWGYRMRGYLEAMKAAGLRAPVVLRPGVRHFGRDQGAAAMEALLALPKRPEAVLCFSDLLAIGAMSVLHRHGLRIPQDVAVMGWDDIAEARYTWPPLSTVRADPDVVARTAVDHLLRQLRGEPITEIDVYVDFVLEIRESTLVR